MLHYSWWWNLEPTSPSHCCRETPRFSSIVNFLKSNEKQSHRVLLCNPQVEPLWTLTFCKYPWVFRNPQKQQKALQVIEQAFLQNLLSLFFFQIAIFHLYRLHPSLTNTGLPPVQYVLQPSIPVDALSQTGRVIGVFLQIELLKHIRNSWIFKKK